MKKSRSCVCFGNDADEGQTTIKKSISMSFDFAEEGRTIMKSSYSATRKQIFVPLGDADEEPFSWHDNTEDSDERWTRSSFSSVEFAEDADEGTKRSVSRVVFGKDAEVGWRKWKKSFSAVVFMGDEGWTKRKVAFSGVDFAEDADKGIILKRSFSSVDLVDDSDERWAGISRSLTWVDFEDGRIWAVREQVHEHQPPLFAETPHLEVFSICLKCDAEVFGKITIDDYTNTYIIFNRDIKNCVFVEAGSSILLTSPERHMEVWDGFIMHYSLQNKKRPGAAFRGTYEFSHSDRKFRDMPMSTDIGCARVNFAVFTSGVLAEIEVTVLQICGNQDSILFYGQLTAKNSLVPGHSVLFRTSAEENMQVKSGERIPLSKRLVAVPTNADLTLVANFNGVTATPTFRSRPSGQTSQWTTIVVAGTGLIQIKVVWAAYEEEEGLIRACL